MNYQDLADEFYAQSGGPETGPTANGRFDPPVASEALFTRDGLQVATLADIVKSRVTHGRGDDGRLWVYHDGVWQPDHDNKIPAAVTGTLGERYRRGHLTNVTDILRYDQTAPRIAGDPVAEYINLANGLYDWRRGEILPHNPDVLSTVQLPVSWADSDACPAFEEFLTEVLPADCIEATDDSPGFIWELIGYILMSGNPLHLAVLLFGSGRNGKGTLLRVLLALIGERNVSSVALHDLMSNRFRVATLFGKLANIAGDLDAKWLESTALFKAITGGDQVQAELKYGATWDFVPWAVPVFSANKAFGSPDSSEGYFSRWVVVPFPNTFVGKEDRNLTAKLTTDLELTGILHRALDALPVLMERGRLPEPDSVKDAKHEFIVASDPVRAWLADRADLDGSTFTIRTVLAKDYKAWCEANDARSMSATELYSRLDTVSAISRKTINGSRGYRGIALKEAFA
jgi:putative DNA primase/helicase